MTSGKLSFHCDRARYWIDDGDVRTTILVLSSDFSAVGSVTTICLPRDDGPLTGGIPVSSYVSFLGENGPPLHPLIIEIPTISAQATTPLSLRLFNFTPHAYPQLFVRNQGIS